jgi:hypothetical protein
MVPVWAKTEPPSNRIEKMYLKIMMPYYAAI